MKTYIYILTIILLSNPVSYCNPDFNTKEMNTSVFRDIPEYPINTAQTFNSIIHQSTSVFMVGNNHYLPESGYGNLKFCKNDVTLLEQIFIRCCKFESKNISTFTDLTKKEFEVYFNNFLKYINRKSLVIFFFSGHGDVDGSLVFTGGEKLTPRELRSLVNSVPNDLVLIIDACHSGENERYGSSNLKTLPAFKKNSIRIYSSLAHQPSKEFEYKNIPYFLHTQDFFRDVLQISENPGNGYFTALIGSFFAHTQFLAKDNVSFYTLVSSLSAKGKDHLEYIENAKGITELEFALRAELRKEHQMPKIMPMETELVFRNMDHVNILLRKTVQPDPPDIETKYKNIIFNKFFLIYWVVDHFFSITLNPSLCLPLESDKLQKTFLPVIAVNYNINVKKVGIFGVGLLTGFGYFENVDAGGIDYQIIPLAFNIKYITHSPTPIFLLVDASVGVGFFRYLTFPENENISPVFQPGFYISAGYGVGINPVKRLGISLSCTFHYVTEMVFFTPGIQINWNF